MSPRPTLSHHWTKEKKKEDFEKKKKEEKKSNTFASSGIRTRVLMGQNLRSYTTRLSIQFSNVCNSLTYMSLQELLPGNVPQTPKNPTVENQGNRRTQNVTHSSENALPHNFTKSRFSRSKTGIFGIWIQKRKVQRQPDRRKIFSEHFVPECTYILT